MKIIIIMTRCN